MGTIRERNGRFTAQIRIMRDKRLVYQQAQTFNRRPTAAAWIKKREGELAQPGALECVQAKEPPLADVIDQYIKELGREVGSTKAYACVPAFPRCEARRHLAPVREGAKHPAGRLRQRPSVVEFAKTIHAHPPDR